MSAVSVSLPELIQLAKRARELSFGGHSLREVHAGQHLSRLMGRGMEFAETRRYQAGDDIRTIDWRVTARTGKAHTKLFSVEKERQVQVCVDLRRPMFFATQGVFKSVQASLLAGYLVWNSVLEGNRIGGLIFDDASIVEMRPSRGKKGGLHFLQSLARQGAFSKEKMDYTDYIAMDEPLNRLARVVRPGSLVFIVSDFRKTAARMEEAIYRIAKHSDVVLCFIYDPLEEELPKGYHLPVISGKREVELNTYQTKQGEQYQKNFAARKGALEALSRHPHIHFHALSTKKDVFEEVRSWKS